MSGPPVLDLRVTSDYEFQWGYQGNENTPGKGFYRPSVPSGMFILGDHAQGSNHAPVGATTVVADDEGAGYLAPPTGYSSLYGGGSGTDIWAPVAPSGYVALGCVATASGVAPDSIDNLRCVRRDLVRPVAPGPWITWAGPVSMYSVPGLGLFQAQAGYPMDAALGDQQHDIQRAPATVEVWVPSSL